MVNLTPSLFVSIGEAMFGPSWRLPLSKEIEVAERTVRRWQNDGATIPTGVRADLAAVCRRRGARLMEFAKYLEGA